ncbi:tetratricopeptide repeat protein [Neochlamydia sp. AcF95]|uniref:tetratricopeptide repeat protein n=1 Tax=Neochlamydia sp. AcF95 TaxID=2795734 RepID=UPI001BC92483|nr:tetratricopeptide repeat protein [Neochlamydia sp. AcF95]
MNHVLSEPPRIHPLIFPTFKHEEEHASLSVRGSTVYEEISLKIFEELGLKDLCQAKIVCKEWRRLVEGSFLAEKTHTLALKLVMQRDNFVKEAFCIEKLGDVYSDKGTAETLLQAAGLYNYSLRISSADQQKIIKKKLINVQRLLTKLCEGKSLSNELIEKQFEGNREVLKNFREEIEEKIQILSENPSPQEVREVYRDIAKGVKNFFSTLVNQAIDVLGDAPCEYAMIGFGSLAREEMTPYSDLEFGILIQEDTSINKKYFRNLTNLLHLKVINLGETILPALNIPCLKAINFFDGLTPRGFAFDGAGVEGKGCKTPLGNGKTFELIQTPGQMAQYIGKDEEGQWWHKKEPHLPMELLNFTHLLGNGGLTKAYDEKIRDVFDMSYQRSLDLRQYLAKQHLVLADMEAFNPGMGDLDREGMLFKVKNDFYRFPHLALDRLAVLKKVAAFDTFTRLDKLSELGIITKGATERLREWMSLALFMRLKTYSHYQAQQEMMNPLLKPFGFEDPDLIEKQFALDHQALKKIKKIYQTFIPFYQCIQEFLAGNEDALKSSDLEDNSPKTRGDILRRLSQNKKAEKWYQQAKNANPQDTEVLNALGIIYKGQGNLDKAAKYSNQTLAISIKLFGENHPSVASCYSNLGAIYQDQGNLAKAVEYSRKALAINFKLFGENHFMIARYYNNLGQIYKEQGNLDKAVKYSKKALAIDLKLFEENHPTVARDYNNLGAIYQAQGNLDKATDYSKKALAISVKLFGENHSRVAICHSNLGQIYKHQGNLGRAAECSNKALAIDPKLFGENHPGVAIDYSNLGQIYQAQDNLDKALEFSKKALAIDLKLYGENHSRVASCYSNLGQIYQDQGNLDKAAEYGTKALIINLKLFGENNPDVAIYYSNLGQIYKEQGNLEKAEKYSTKALAIDLKLFGENHPSVAINYSNLGQIYKDQGNLEKAEKYSTKALAINLKLFGENHPSVAINYSNLGAIYKDQGNLGKAAECSNRGLAINLNHFGENHPDVAINYSNLGAIYKDQGNLEKAAECSNKALDIELKLFGENHSHVETNYSNLGVIYQAQGNLDKAAKCGNKALDIELKLFGENHLRVVTRYSTLGEIYKEKGDLGKAAEYSTKALTISVKLFGENHHNVAICYNQLGGIYQQQGNFNKAFKHISKALELAYRLYGRNHRTVIKFCNDLMCNR